MSVRERRPRTAKAVFVGSLAVSLAIAGLSAASAATSGGRSVLRGSRPRWATSAARVGTASPGGGMIVRVYLAPRGGIDALKAAVAAVSTPGSSQYRRFITPAQYRARFEPTGGAVRAVTSWLSRAGFGRIKVETSHRWVEARGSAAAAAQAFGVSFGTYRVRGKTYSSPTTDASVPSSLASEVLGVSGLDNMPRIDKPNVPHFPPPDGFRNGRPCSAYFGQIKAKYQADYSTPLPKFNGNTYAYAVCGYTPTQLKAAYGVYETDLTGAGTAVAITDAYNSPTILSDANTYGTKHGDGPFAAGQFVQWFGGESHGDLCGGNGWYGEETLDVEAVHGMAPDAKVLYYGAKSCFDADLRAALTKVVDDNQASIVTNSWSEPAYYVTSDMVAAYQQIFLQGALQGIGFQFSSGDNGDWLQALGVVTTDYPASDTYATAIGGTTTKIDANGNLSGQTGWGTVKWSLSSDGQSWNLVGYLYGSGGGFSTLANRPDYQNGVVPPGSPAGRAVPDVSLDADPTTGMLIGETQVFPDGTYYDEYRIGGTSLSSPLFAGIQALATEAAGSRLGFMNPTLYSLARSDPSAFTDVLHIAQGANVRADYANGVDPSDGILYSVRTFDQDSSLKTRPGWDDVTGIGTPNANYLNSYSRGG